MFSDSLQHMLEIAPFAAYSSARFGLDPEGLPVFFDCAHADQMQGPINLAFRDGPMLQHYYHWVETFLAAFAVHEHYYSAVPIVRLLVGRQAWNNPLQNNVQGKILRAIYGDVDVVEGDHLVGERLDNVLVFDRFAIGRKAGARFHLNKYLEPFLPIARLHAQKFRARILATAPPGGAAIRAGHVRRPPPRAFTPELESRLEDLFGGEPLEFGAMSFENQVSCCTGVDLLYGVHGNGLTNLMWMAPGSAVFEFFPEHAHHYDYQILAELFDIRYFGFQGANVWREFSRHGEAIGHEPELINAPVSQVDWTALRLCLEHVAATRPAPNRGSSLF
jgi:hypothetical protein